MKKTMKKNGVAPLNDLRSMCQEFDVKFIACEMTVAHLSNFDYQYLAQ
jgi:peroxiredoxin family protein